MTVPLLPLFAVELANPLAVFVVELPKPDGDPALPDELLRADFPADAKLDEPNEVPNAELFVAEDPNAVVVEIVPPKELGLLAAALPPKPEADPKPDPDAALDAELVPDVEPKPAVAVVDFDPNPVFDTIVDPKDDPETE